MSNTRRALRVAIVGAGIGGLTAAAALRQFGNFEIQVYERAPALGEVGAGLQMAPNAVKVIRALNLEDRFVRLAAEPKERVTMKWDNAAVLSRESFKGRMEEEFSARYHMIHRADLHKLLATLVPENAIHTDAACVGIENRRDGAVLRLAGGQELEADVVIGADGIHSVVREALFGASRTRFTHQICWRLILPMEALRETAARFDLPLDGTEYAGLLGPTGHVIMYPLRGGELWNIFAGRVSEQWADEKWTVPSAIDEMLEAYAGWHPGLLHLLAQAQETYKWGIYDRDPLAHWNNGRIALLGDAAHPMMPTLAQGAAISMEDGYVLARCLDAGRDDPVAALAAYDAARQPRASKVQMQARQQFLNNQMTPPPPFLPTDWIYGYDAVTSRTAFD